MKPWVYISLNMLTGALCGCLYAIIYMMSPIVFFGLFLALGMWALMKVGGSNA